MCRPRQPATPIKIDLILFGQMTFVNKWLMLRVTRLAAEIVAMFRKSLFAVLAFALPLIVTGTASADGNAQGDEYGNVILQEAGGPKIILVGQRATRSDVMGQEIRNRTPVHKRAQGISVIYPPSDPLVVDVIPAPDTSCDAPIIVKGLSYRYGLDRNEIAILQHPPCP